MFAEGDFISHGTNGVCRVEGFTQMDVPGTGQKKEYYILKPVYDQKATVYSPVESGNTLECRTISEKTYRGYPGTYADSGARSQGA